MAWSKNITRVAPPISMNVTSTTVKQMPSLDDTNLRLVSSYVTPYESAWFKNTWFEDNRGNAVELFPYKLIQLNGDGSIKAAFTLPITPQQLNISTPFAVVTTPTLNGIVEEHNSIRFKDIEMSGTMGVYPAGRNRQFSNLEQLRIFDPSGFIDSLDSIAASIPLAQLIILQKETLVDPEEKDSGYANLHRLRIFLESYAEEKKTNKDLRLVFASYKDNQYYYVAPTSFSVRRSASSPMEYEYSLAMRSWGSYDPSAKATVFHQPPHLSPVGVAGLVVAGLTAISSRPTTILAGNNFSDQYGRGATWVTIGKSLVNYSGWATVSSFLSGGTQPTVEQVSELSTKTSEASSTMAGSFDMMPRVWGITNPYTGAPTVVPSLPNIQQTPPSNEQMEILFNLNDLKINLDHLKASLMSSASTQANPLDYVAGLASKSGIAFQTSVSKYPVSFPANATLEHLSAKYLNDPNRWIEIATLNGLQSPYVDNKGFDVPFLFDGTKNKVIIQTNALDIGESVTLSSRTQPRKTYGVVSYIQNGYYYEVTLDNDPFSKLPNSSNVDDLSRYKVADFATLHYYTPNTVRAGQILYIPSNEPSNINEFNTNQIPSLKQYQEEIRIGGVDLLLNAPTKEDLEGTVQSVSSCLDLVIQDNDAALSYGITNLKQSLYLILFTPQGSILQHSTFGIGTVAGQSNADVNYDSFNQSIKNAILQDKSFSDVEFITSSLNGPVLTINLGVRIAQLNKVLPIAFDINLKGA